MNHRTTEWHVGDKVECTCGTLEAASFGKEYTVSNILPIKPESKHIVAVQLEGVGDRWMPVMFFKLI